MPKKPKFRPRITRVKLNPEQAVLACECFAGGRVWDPPASGPGPFFACSYAARVQGMVCGTRAGATVS